MTALVLRDYQAAAVDAVWNSLAEEGGNQLAVLPTGTGKALCIAEFVRRALHEYPETRIVVATHSRELVEQNYNEMKTLWPQCPAGIYSAGLNRRDIKAQVIFGSIQSLHRKAFALQLVDVVIVDEAQSIPRTADTMWRKFLGDLLQINGYLKVVGWTATAYRLDSGMLHKGENALFSNIAYEYNVRDAIEQGYLCPPITTSAEKQIDTTGVGIRGGEFIPGQLEAAANDPDTVEAIADEIVQHGQDRRGWAIFGCGVAHCTALRDAVRKRGFSCEGVFATTPSADRTAIIKAFRRQEIRALTSVNALTVGFNAPHLDLVALARPTKSAGLYVQAVGRGLRQFPGKANALILDMGGNIARFGPVDAVTVREKRKSDEAGEMPIKECPECGAGNPISATECADCGFLFGPAIRKVDTKAAALAILSTQAQSEWLAVNAVAYRRHEKPEKPPTFRVDYTCGIARHSSWWCPEHSGFARQKFVQTWQRHAPGVSVPNTVDEALANAHALAKPTKIQIRAAGRFTEIVGVSFA